jgi:hypothetical protein
VTQPAPPQLLPRDHDLAQIMILLILNIEAIYSCSWKETPLSSSIRAVSARTAIIQDRTTCFARLLATWNVGGVGSTALFRQGKYKWFANHFNHPTIIFRFDNASEALTPGLSMYFEQVAASGAKYNRTIESFSST